MKIDQVKNTVFESLKNISKAKKVLLIHPDYSRNDYTHLLTPLLYDCLLEKGLEEFDTLNAGGTHRAMTESELVKKLGVSPKTHPKVKKMLNHEFDNQSQLMHATTIDRDFIKEKTSGNLDQTLEVDVNKIITDGYDLIVAISGTVPHEALGYSGGTKIFFPGISGPGVIGLLHWAAVLMGVPRIIGTVDNPARDVVNKGTKEIFKLIDGTPILSLNMVYTEDDKHNAVPEGLYHGVGFDGFVNAHKEASSLSSKLHIKYLDRPKKVIVQQLPLMYDEVWTAGKGSYKVQKPGVLAEGGEIILLAPHIHCFHSNKKLDQDIKKIGYHGMGYVLDYCKKNPSFDKNIASHVINVRGFGSFENNIEKFPFKLSLATQLSKQACEDVNLDYRNFNDLKPEDFQDDDSLWIPDGGQWLYDRAKN